MAELAAVFRSNASMHKPIIVTLLPSWERLIAGAPEEPPAPQSQRTYYRNRARLRALGLPVDTPYTEAPQAQPSSEDAAIKPTAVTLPESWERLISGAPEPRQAPVSKRTQYRNKAHLKALGLPVDTPADGTPTCVQPMTEKIDCQ